MGRWEPNAQGRLVRAAIDLFSEQGYDRTTVSEIAERAGLTKTTFFRYFPDKREVLFAGQETLSQLLRDEVTAAPDAATPLDAVTAALDAVTAVFTPVQREFGPRLQLVIAANSELREREAIKRASLATAMTEALQKRGVPPTSATLAAGLGVLALHQGFDRWIDPGNEQSFTDLTRRALRELRAAVSTLD
jgi:AcrR family transcriptional regulator